MSVFDERIIKFGEKLCGRLEEWRIEDALSYICHGETWLAFETLYDILADFNVSLTAEEYDEMIRLAEEMEFNLDDPSLKYLKKLIK